eukprot:365611-Chlamydomonas_euryale.AAC.18
MGLMRNSILSIPIFWTVRKIQTGNSHTRSHVEALARQWQRVTGSGRKLGTAVLHTAVPQLDMAEESTAIIQRNLNYGLAVARPQLPNSPTGRGKHSM